MRKMKLEVEGLSVESFDVLAGDADAHGTVRANEATALCTRAPACTNTGELSCTGSCRTGLNCQQVC